MMNGFGKSSGQNKKNFIADQQRTLEAASQEALAILKKGRLRTTRSLAVVSTSQWRWLNKLAKLCCVLDSKIFDDK
jgi:hypothetical protein